MRNIFTKLFFTIAMMTCSLTVFADTAVLSWYMGENGTAATSANSITGATGCDAEGFTIAISGNDTKTWANGNGDITYNAKTYKTLKNSNGTQNTITLPEGMYASKVEFYATANADANAVLSEFNGAACSDVVSSQKDYTDPTYISKTLSTPVNSFTFTFSTKQVCFIAIVTYSNSVTPTCAEPTIQFGTWNSTEEGFPVTITNNQEGATLSYAIGEGEYQAYTASFYVGSEALVKAKASKDGYTDAIVSETAPVHVDGDAEGTFAWLVGNEASATITSAKSDCVTKTEVATGTGLTIGTKNNYDANNGNTMVTYIPSTANAGNVAEVMIEYSITMAKGTTFQLSNIKYDALKDGTDYASYSWSYTVDGVESTITTVDKDHLIRNNNTTGEPALRHDEAVTADAGKKVTVRFYVSGFGNTKKFALSNIEIVGIISGDPIVRTFQDFKIEFRDNPYTVILPGSGTLPTGVTVDGTSYNGGQHGIYGGTITVPVDGAVLFTIGACQYSGGVITVQKDGENFTTINNNASCGEVKPNYNQNVTWKYNSEDAATLTFNIPSNVYIPYFFAEKDEYLALVDVTYYDADGVTIIGIESVENGSALAFAYGASDVTVADGKAFRGWFASADATALKVASGTTVNNDLSLYAKATDIEVAANGTDYSYDLTKEYFYQEDHELLTMTNGSYYNNHGWHFGTNGTIAVEVAGNATVQILRCQYGNGGTITCTDALSNQVGDVVDTKAASCGSIAEFVYTGPATTLTCTLSNGGYIHGVNVISNAETTYNRTHPHMKLNTLCFPYTVTAYTGATFYTMLYKRVEGSTPIKVVLEEHVGNLEAGNPYFYIPEGSQLELTYSGDRDDSPNTVNGVVGSYDANATVPSGSYVTYDGEIRAVGENVKLAEYRAYINMDEVSDEVVAPAPGRRILRVGNADAPAIVTDVESILQSAVCRKVIRDGQLIIIREDKMYNAQGQPVK